MARKKPEEEPSLIYNPSYFKNVNEFELSTLEFKKDYFFMPGIFFTDEFKKRVLRYVPSVVPAAEGSVNFADFAREMTLSEAYMRTAGNVLRPAQFLTLLRLFLASDRRKKRDDKKILRVDAPNIFCVVTRNGLVAVWVETNHPNPDFSGCAVFAFDIEHLLVEEGDIRLSEARFFV